MRKRYENVGQLKGVVLNLYAISNIHFSKTKYVYLATIWKIFFILPYGEDTCLLKPAVL